MRCGPTDLYNKYWQWRKTGGAQPSWGVEVVEMMEARARNGALGWDMSGASASGKAQVHLEKKKKCAFLLNCVAQKNSDERKPQGLKLPRTEEVRNSILLGGRHKLFVSKIDLSSCFWRI